MSSLFERAKYDAFKGDYLTRLLYLNISVFLLFALTNAFTSLFTGNFGLIPNLADDLLALPSDPLRLLLRPWTILTYMFTHFGFRHILFNMIVLYFSGKILMEYLGEKRMLALYIYGGIGGGLLYIILYNLSPILGQGSMVGASAGCIAVLVAGALYMPQMPVRLWGIFEIKYWMLAAGIVTLDVLNLTGSNAGGHIAHLGGAIVAFFFIRSMRQGHEWNVYLFQIIDAVRNMLFRPKSKKKRRGFSFGESSYVKYEEVKKPKSSSVKSTQDTAKMDTILDKIKDKGYDSLSKEEKAYLFKISNEE
ncbi:MAG TPA: rhomboid family intramembrane serine protease [Cryomorphaceae bacterium]|nr:rhomboid family intramembrane serine protease [Cryomorphaceae bacterium]